MIVERIGRERRMRIEIEGKDRRERHRKVRSKKKEEDFRDLRRSGDSLRPRCTRKSHRGVRRRFSAHPRPGARLRGQK